MDRLEGVWPQGQRPFEPDVRANLIASYGLSPDDAIRIFFDSAVSVGDVQPGDVVFDPGGSNTPSTTAVQHDFNCIDYHGAPSPPINGDPFDFVPASPNFVPAPGSTTNNPADASPPDMVHSVGGGFSTVEFGTAVAPGDFPPGCFQNQTTSLSNAATALRVTDSLLLFDTAGSPLVPDDWQLVVSLPPNYVTQPMSGQWSD